jgi:hypothetical protein
MYLRRVRGFNLEDSKKGCVVDIDVSLVFIYWLFAACSLGNFVLAPVDRVDSSQIRTTKVACW